LKFLRQLWSSNRAVADPSAVRPKAA
jgi:hypothetical protein